MSSLRHPPRCYLPFDDFHPHGYICNSYSASPGSSKRVRKSHPLSRVAADIHFLHSINPYWKLALIFKCLTDNIMLDDFKTELQRLGGANLERDMSMRRTATPPPLRSMSHVIEKPQDAHIEVSDAASRHEEGEASQSSLAKSS
jgi:hypothetical protein